MPKVMWRSWLSLSVGFQNYLPFMSLPVHTKEIMSCYSYRSLTHHATLYQHCLPKLQQPLFFMSRFRFLWMCCNMNMDLPVLEWGESGSAIVDGLSNLLKVISLYLSKNICRQSLDQSR